MTTEIQAEMTRLATVCEALRAKAVELNAQYTAMDQLSVEGELVGGMIEGLQIALYRNEDNMRAIMAELAPESDF